MFEKPDQIEEKILSIVDDDIRLIFYNPADVTQPYRGVPCDTVLRMQIARYLKELVMILREVRN